MKRCYDIYYIYVIQNMLNGKTYIGQRKCPKNKKPSEDTHYLGSGYILKKAFKKYGRKNFKKEILEVCCTKGEADFLERRYIAFYRLCGFAEYNIADGGQGGVLSDEILTRRLETMRSPEYREKMSKAMKGVNKGDKNAAKRPEVRERISMSMRGKSSGHNFNVKKGFHWYTNGVINKRGYECPKGFWIGKTKK